MNNYIVRYSLEIEPTYVAEKSFAFQARDLEEASKTALQHALNESSPILAFTLESLSSQITESQ